MTTISVLLEKCQWILTQPQICCCLFSRNRASCSTDTVVFPLLILAVNTFQQLRRQFLMHHDFFQCPPQLWQYHHRRRLVLLSLTTLCK